MLVKAWRMIAGGLEPMEPEAALRAGEDLRWVDVTGAEGEALEALLQPLELPGPLLEHVVEPSLSAQALVLQHALFVEMPCLLRADAQPVFVRAVCLPGLLVTLHQVDVPGLERSMAEARPERRPAAQADGASALFAFLEHLVLLTTTRITALRREVNELLLAYDEDPADVDMDGVLGTKRLAGRLTNLAEDQLHCVSVLPAVEMPGFSLQAARLQYAGLLNHLKQAHRSCGRLETRLQDIRFQHFLSMQERTDRRLRLLTVLTFVMGPALLVSGVFGMNFHDIPGLDAPWGFLAALGCMAVAAVGMLLWFWRSGWFD